MLKLTELAHEAVRSVVRPGEAVVDATCGNGHDTLFLASLVGKDGDVHAFDIQKNAIEQTLDRVAASGCEQVVLHHRSHAELDTVLTEAGISVIAAMMFNLGYLPGGDHAVTTKPQATLAALRTGSKMLRTGGVMTVLAYVGHPGGMDEAAEVEQFLGTLGGRFEVQLRKNESPVSPRLWIVGKRSVEM
ncbi:class I SAM-dependent methyltransferase [Rubinisphaera margarita]|uniref:class I SAM-dependent methyltransferase n=1 Tax=Rubinisphaera margarita TaxID=2909586 RepID=UPI001EE95D00|nr:class I SAM-dependent methyltransferase [Rubinisphaera margarita]MCG6154433.1 methyltransferase domain-containing protein [Rubinisphaera margarita]